MKQKVRFSDIAFFSAACLFFSLVEYSIPKPLPFLRIGLSNIPILAALKKYTLKEVFLITLFKIFFQAVISGTFFSYVFIFSLTGSFASVFAMILFYKLCKENISYLGLSILGSMANALAQIACSFLIVFGKNTVFIAPILLTSSLITGTLLGVFSESFCSISEWYSFYCGNLSPSLPENMGTNVNKGVQIFAFFRFIVGIIILPIFLFLKNIYALWTIVLIFLLLNCILRKGKIKIVPSILVCITVTFFALLSPSGKVLLTIGHFKVTDSALYIGLRRSAVLCGSVFISQFAISRDLPLRGKIATYLKLVLSFFKELTASQISLKKSPLKNIDLHLIKCWVGINLF